MTCKTYVSFYKITPNYTFVISYVYIITKRTMANCSNINITHQQLGWIQTFIILIYKKYQNN